MNQLLHFRIIVVIIAGLCSSVLSAQQLPPALQSRFQFVLDSIVYDSVGTPYLGGLSAAVRIKNSGNWSGASGNAAAVGTGVTTAIPMSDTMILRAYSCTKQYTAAIILQLMAEGRLSLDDTIAQWIDTLVSAPISGIRNNATIRHCLTHGSGHGDYVTNIGFILNVLGNGGTKIYSPRECLTFAGTPLFPLGNSRAYSSTNYILLGMVAEAVTDSSMLDLMRHRIFLPLGLNNTFFASNEPVQGFLAHPHDNLSILGIGPNATNNLQNVWPFTSIVTSAWATGAIASTAEDLAKFGMALYDTSLLSIPALDSMLFSIDSTVLPIPPNVYDDFPGYGVFNNSSVAPGFIGHGGSAIGYRAFNYGNPASGIQIAIIANQQPANLNPVARAFVQAVQALVLGIESEQQSPVVFSIYPNPATDYVNFSFHLHNSTPINIQIVNMLGEIVSAEAVSGFYATGLHNFRIPVSELGAGLYIVTLKTNQGTITKRLIKR